MQNRGNGNRRDLPQLERSFLSDEFAEIDRDLERR